MKKILLLSFMLLLTLSFNALAQERTVSGKVTDSDGSGLPGVNVILKGTNKGDITDIDGNYKLSVPSEGGTLQFSFIGLKSVEVEIGARSVIDVTMEEDVETLSEVVVTGYGVATKRDLTGSIAQIKGDVIENLPMQSFDKALQGRAAGVLVQANSGAPGATINILVRGQGSLSNNTPLYIVDGVQVNTGSSAGQASNNALGGVNPADIESIEILKDAASAAIYGAQAANGVVLITTKRGRSGATNLDITYQKGFVQPLELYDVMNAQQYAEIRAEAYANNPSTERATAIGLFGDPENPASLTNFDWVDAIFRESANQDILNVRLSGGDDKTTYFMSASLEGTQGQVIKSNFSRQTFRLNLARQANEKLKVDATIGVVRVNQFGSIANGNFVNGPFQSAFVSQPNSPAFNEDGTYAPYPNNTTGHNFSYNIVQGVNEERRENFIAQAIGSLGLTYKILPYLTANVLGGLDFVDSQSINERPATIPVFAGFGGQTFVDNRRNLSWNTNATLTFSKTFGEDHSVSVIAGIEATERINEQNTATGRGFASPSLRLLGAAATPQAINGTLTSFTRAGYFGRANYSFRNLADVSATIRRDGSSRFGEQVRFGTFYSVGANWSIIDMGFMSGVSVLDDLKLRASYGVLGNAQGIGNFQAVPAVTGARQYLGNGGQAFQIANDQLTWERSQQLNIGISVGLLKNRIFLSADYFNNQTEDQLLAVPLPGDSGFGSITGNVGEVLNEGLELELSVVTLDKGGFKWVTSGNISFQNNEILSLNEGQEQINPGASTRRIVGQPINVLWGVDYVGVNPANGKAMWRDNAGNIQYGNFAPEDGRVVGSPIPDSFGGLTNTFSYKGITLDIFFQFQLGAEAFNGDLANLAASGGRNDNQLVSQLDRWQQPGDVTNVPRAYEGEIIDGFHQALRNDFGTFRNTRYISDASYVRLKQVNLTYSFPKSITDKLNMRSLSIFAQATNLLTWTKFDGIDPEVITSLNTSFNSGNARTGFGVFPVGKQYNAGISIGF